MWEQHLVAAWASGAAPVCISRMWNWLSTQSALRTGKATNVSACAIHTARSSLPWGVPAPPLLASANSSSLESKDRGFPDCSVLQSQAFSIRYMGQIGRLEQTTSHDGNASGLPPHLQLWKLGCRRLPI